MGSGNGCRDLGSGVCRSWRTRTKVGYTERNPSSARIAFLVLDHIGNGEVLAGIEYG
jgi:hypothetical protein